MQYLGLIWNIVYKLGNQFVRRIYLRLNEYRGEQLNWFQIWETLVMKNAEKNVV